MFNKIIARLKGKESEEYTLKDMKNSVQKEIDRRMEARSAQNRQREIRAMKARNNPYLNMTTSSLYDSNLGGYSLGGYSSGDLTLSGATMTGGSTRSRGASNMQFGMGIDNQSSPAPNVHYKENHIKTSMKNHAISTIAGYMQICDIFRGNEGPPINFSHAIVEAVTQGGRIDQITEFVMKPSKVMLNLLEKDEVGTYLGADETRKSFDAEQSKFNEMLDYFTHDYAVRVFTYSEREELKGSLKNINKIASYIGSGDKGDFNIAVALLLNLD